MSNRFNRAAEISRDLMRTGLTPVLQPIDLNGMVNSFRTAYNDAAEKQPATAEAAIFAKRRLGRS